MNIKQAYELMKVNLCVDREIRELFSEYLKVGNIIKVISRSREKFSICSPDLPSEYFSKDSIVNEIMVQTENNEKYVIIEEYFGINFEAPCDKYNFSVRDQNDYLLATTNDLREFLDAKYQAKQKRKGKIK